MTEWKLFEDDNPPCSTVAFFREHPWVPPEVQAGHAERIAMTERMIREMVDRYGFKSISDLGCGDGSLMNAIRDLPVRLWGYDAGPANVQKAQEKGLDVTERDILSGGIRYGDLVTCCEVVEHLARPHEFLRDLPAKTLIVSSPSAETGEWHYPDHTWAWDLDGYATLMHDAGWLVIQQDECDGGVNWHGGVPRRQRFQAIFARRP